MGVVAVIADATCPPVLQVPLGEGIVPVVHPSRWPPSAILALAGGNARAWARECTADDGVAWEAADPTRGQVAGFLSVLEALTGQQVSVMAHLVRFLDQYADEVTADLQRFYATDLRDLFRPSGGLSYQRLHAFLNALPGESATKTAIRDRMTREELDAAGEPEGWGAWSRTDELLAILNDRVSWLTYVTAAAAGGKPSEPEEMRRPGVGMTGRMRRIQERLTSALIQYTRDHDGAYPPPDWDHGIDVDSIE